jgi:hypothetical protein
VEKLSDALFPNELPQERVFSVADFINMYGFGVIDRMIETIDPLQPVHGFLQM